MRSIALLASIVALGAAPSDPAAQAGTFQIANGPGPYIGGGTLTLQYDGAHGPVTAAVAGPGSVSGMQLDLPAVASPQTVTVVAATRNAFALRRLQLVPPPPPAQALIAVATYYGGIALHDARTFRLIGIVPAPGAAGDVAFGFDGSIVAPMTGGDTLLTVRRNPWQVVQTAGVPLGNEVLAARDGSVFVSNRDINGKGAVTRISGGAVTRTETGITAEGLALNERTHRLYVGNVNDDSIAELDSQTLRVLRHIPAVPRVFGIALDAVHGRIFAVSNQNSQMRKAGGYVVAIDLRTGKIAARSRDIPFPVGAAFDARTNALFVTDEDYGNVYTLDGTSLAERRPARFACGIPWRPHIDPARRAVFIPCTRENQVVVLDVASGKPLAGSPFSTGQYPLGVATQ